jgi:signal transduction histidine kinase
MLLFSIDKDVGMLRPRGPGRIRTQMLFGMSMLFIVVTILAFSSFQGVAKFRKLTKSIRIRATELPLAAELNQRICDLRVTLYQYSFRRSEFAYSSLAVPSHASDRMYLAQQFKTDLAAVKHALIDYGKQLRISKNSDERIGDTRLEVETVGKINDSLQRIEALWDSEDCVFGDPAGTTIGDELSDLQEFASELPGFMKDRMDDFHDEARNEYHTWMTISAVNTLAAVLLILYLGQRFRVCLFKPLQALVNGSRIVAAGNFQHRIRLKRNDEVSELAEAMNEMTRKFCSIRDDLDRQVRLRTKEVVRSEQLASVGFLAAGVAHEINNPLASIAWSAESLESRLQELFDDDEDDTVEGEPHVESEEEQFEREEIAILQRYLKRIQEEAFRCKGITDSLLDFSRLGDTKKQATDLSELVTSVIEMLQHLGKYRRKTITFESAGPIIALVTPQEIKQVVLNLITNGLDSLNEDGSVKVTLTSDGQCATITVTDNGCGMSEEVMQHLFEPFFTRRRDGSGTGLGLSITYQIIADHGGTIEPSSAGPGHGSTFKIFLPMVEHEKAKETFRKAA